MPYVLVATKILKLLNQIFKVCDQNNGMSEKIYQAALTSRILNLEFMHQSLKA